MKPAKLNVVVYQGSTFSKKFQWSSGTPATPVDLTGCKIRMQIREKLSSANAITSCTTENGKIVITDATAGKFEIEISSDETATFVFKSAVYDIEVEYPGTPVRVKRIIEGSVALSLEVTK